ncbi:MAG: AsmA family protein [Spartobacteria bacterium]|nr:AsmA family protein [Spartobacteria bacterium]
MKLIRNLVIIVVILLIGLVLARNALLKSGARKAIEEYTGFKLEIDSFNVGLFKPTFEIKGLKLLNPPDFPEANAFEIDHLFVKYDLASLFSDKIHLYDVIIDVPRIVVIQKEDGETNIGRLTKKSEKDRDKKKDDVEKKADKPGKEKKSKEIEIDIMRIKLGTVEFRRYEEGVEAPEVRTHELNKEETFTNVKNIQDVINQITMQLLADEGLKELNKWAEEHQEDLEKMGLKSSDVEKVGNAVKGFLKNFEGK